MSGLDKVRSGMFDIYERKKAASYALCIEYAARALQKFQQEQAENKFWINQTFQAMDRMIAEAYSDEDVVGWFMAHTVEYGPALESANNGLHAAIRPTVEGMLPQFMKELSAIWGHDV